MEGRVDGQERAISDAATIAPSTTAASAAAAFTQDGKRDCG